MSGQNESADGANHDGVSAATGDLSSRDAILAATVEVLTHAGEASVRMASIADSAGVAIGLISYHFGDREGLIRAAQLACFSQRSYQDLATIEQAVATMDDPAELLVALRALTRVLLAEVASQNVRLRRVAQLGSGFGRPELLEDMGVVQRDLTERFGRVAMRGQRIGLIRPELNAEAVGLFIQAYSLGLVLGDIDPQRPADDALADAIMAAVEGMCDPAVVASVKAASPGEDP